MLVASFSRLRRLASLDWRYQWLSHVRTNAAAKSLKTAWAFVISLLPDIAARAKREGRTAHIWPAGCTSGEEPYTLKIPWDLEVASSYAGVLLSIIATDIDEDMLTRARGGLL